MEQSKIRVESTVWLNCLSWVPGQGGCRSSVGCDDNRILLPDRLRYVVVLSGDTTLSGVINRTVEVRSNKTGKERKRDRVTERE